jgi:hypothetical protein
MEDLFEENGNTLRLMDVKRWRGYGAGMSERTELK